MVELVGAITTCVSAPPSDHERKVQDFFAFVCGDGAEIVLLDPWMTVRVNGVAAVAPLNARFKPPGFVLSVRATVRRTLDGAAI